MLQDNSLCFQRLHFGCGSSTRHGMQHGLGQVVREMLQHYRVGQTWSHAMDLGPDGECVRNEWGSGVDRSFCAAWLDRDVELLQAAIPRAAQKQ
jgi:hypothetical protein